MRQVQLPGGAYLSATGLRDVNSRNFDAQLSFTMPLDTGAIASLTGGSDGTNQSGMALYAKSADLDGGLGYRMLGQWDRTTRVEGDVNWIGQHAALMQHNHLIVVGDLVDQVRRPQHANAFLGDQLAHMAEHRTVTS